MSTPHDDGARATSPPELELEFPPRAEFVRTVRHTVTSLARLHGLPDDVCENIRLAVSEVCTTSVGAGGDPERMIHILAWKEEGRFVVELVDPASTLGQAVSGDPSEIDTGDLPFEGALALPIVRGLVDEVAITPGEDGVRLRMELSLGE